MTSSRSLLLKTLIPFALVLLGAIWLLVWAGGGREPVRIAAILSLTGTGGEMVDVRDAMQLAVEEVNAQGGIDNRKLELVIADSKSSPAEAARIFHRLEQQGPRPLLYVSTLSAIGMTLAPLAVKHQVVLLGLATSTPAFAEQGRWVFRDSLNAREETRVALRVLDTLKVRQLGIIHLDDPFGNSVAELLAHSLTAKAMSATVTAFADEVVDLTSQIEQVRALPAVYVAGRVAHLNLAIRQLRQAGYSGPIIASFGAADPRVAESSMADGVYVGIPPAGNEDFFFISRFRDRYQARFGKPFSFHAAAGYDSVRMIAGLLEDNTVSRPSLQQLLAQGFRYSGVQGDYELKAGSQEITMPLYPARIEHGRLRLIE